MLVGKNLWRGVLFGIVLHACSFVVSPIRRFLRVTPRLAFDSLRSGTIFALVAFAGIFALAPTPGAFASVIVHRHSVAVPRALIERRTEIHSSVQLRAAPLTQAMIFADLILFSRSFLRIDLFFATIVFVILLWRESRTFVRD